VDFDTHKILADNACIKTSELLDKPELTKEEAVILVDFAHTARLHYWFSGFDKNTPEMKENLKKANELVERAYRKLGLEKAATWFKESTSYDK